MDDVITLVAETITGHDKYGNEIKTTSSRDIFCRVYSVDRNEFYSAATAGFKPELTVRISDYMDYQGEKIAKLHGIEYDIIRTYMGRTLDLNELELVLQRTIANG